MNIFPVRIGVEGDELSGSSELVGAGNVADPRGVRWDLRVDPLGGVADTER